MSVWLFLFSSKSHPDTKEQRRLHSFLMSFTLFLSEQTATHSSSLSLSFPHTRFDGAPHPFLAGCLLQKRRGGLRWRMPQTPSPTPARYRPLRLFLPSDGKVMAGVKGRNIFYFSVFLTTAREKRSAATNKSHVPASLHPQEQPFIQLHRLSARTKALQSPLISHRG